MIVALIIFFATLTGKLLIDLKQYHSRKKINHAAEAFIVACLLTLASFFAGWISAPMWFLGFWCLFDPAFALLIGQQFFYVGTTSKLDILQSKYPLVLILKYFLFIGSIILFIWLR